MVICVGLGSYFEYSSTMSCSLMFSGIWARSGMVMNLPLMLEPSHSSQSKRAALVAKLSVPVFLGGPIAATHFDGLKKSGVHLIGTDIESGLKQISAQLGR